MKLVYLLVSFAFVIQPASAATTNALWRTNADSQICDPIFSKLDSLEKGVSVAQAEAPEKNTPEASKPDENELANELSAMLQACSYDGKAIKVDGRALDKPAEAEGAAAVNAVMRFTGLPQNFTIMESNVPNASAIILLGRDGIPQRVIAYNKDFMKEVAAATSTGDWPSLSIMAHEIGHHLSGHTLLPGGSKPPIELEADKFSGFVLFKMGASLTEAQEAIAKLVGQADDSTHPGRERRLTAVETGWQESCAQQQSDCDTGMLATKLEKAVTPSALPKKLPATTPGTSISQQEAAPLPDIPGPLDIIMPGKSSGQKIGAPVIDHMPKLAASATPSKFDRFVYDEVGIFDPLVRNKLQETAYQFAAARGVEIVTMVTKDLQDRTPDQFALDAMRQLRVGKLDVGNGAVLVVATNTRQVGVAFGPGILVELDKIDAYKGQLESYFKLTEGGARPQIASRSIPDASYRIMRETKSRDWAIRFNSLDEFQTANEKTRQEREKTGAPFDPERDPAFLKLVRIDATIVTRSADLADGRLEINEPKTRHTGPAMHVRTHDGKDVVLYVNANVPALMPVDLQEGKRYAFIARSSVLIRDIPQMDLISYDLLD